jgi:S-methylmethionine-dependent homocysteine/selenocysteine methylase
MAKDMFLILSVKHSEGRKPCFWRPDNAGYTLYTKEQVENDPDYYNNGYDTLAIELSNEGLESIGFKCQMDLDDVKELSKKAKIAAGERAKRKEVSNG